MWIRVEKPPLIVLKLCTCLKHTTWSNYWNCI